jgi:hypothetical protein
MSDRTHTAQTGVLADSLATEGAAILPGRPAAQETRGPSTSQALTEPANQSDLASISISSSEVMRVSQRVEPRRDLTAPKLGRSPAPSASTSPRKATPEKGILTNPSYQYSGGLLSRVITLFANILKFIERLILRLLSGPDGPAISSRTQDTSTKNEPKTDPKQDQAERERSKRQKESAQTIRRS